VGEQRSAEQLRRHYEIEKELADRLRKAPPEERRRLYPAVYTELFRSVPDHPAHTRKLDAAAAAANVEQQRRLLDRFLNPRSRFLEIGAGDGSLAVSVAKNVAEVCAVDVADQFPPLERRPSNCRFLVIADGCRIPLPEASVDVAYSNQVMEHLHPEDAAAQLREIYRVLAPGGSYLCITPNRVCGPHDVSKFFDDVATGFHLREYRVGELVKLFRETGFEQVRAFAGLKGRFFVVPWRLLHCLETLFWMLPGGIRKSLGAAPGLRNLLTLTVAGRRPASAG